MIKHGSMMINAVSNSTVPHISLLIGASYGAGHYGMCGRAYDPRFLFAWPSAKSAVMGGTQLAGVLSIVSRAAAEARGQQVDEDADAALRAAVEAQIEAESLPMFLSGWLYDDGVIDPRDTRPCWECACPPSQVARSRDVELRRLQDVAMISRLLVANRGEIARRVFATCRRFPRSTVAVYTDPDADAPHVAEADVRSTCPASGATWMSTPSWLRRARPAPTPSTPDTDSFRRTPNSRRR